MTRAQARAHSREDRRRGGRTGEQKRREDWRAEEEGGLKKRRGRTGEQKRQELRPRFPHL